MAQPSLAFRLRGAAAALALAAALGACGGGQPADTSPSSVANAAPDARGVITYASYQVAVAREADTVATLAARVGAAPDALSRRNGLPQDYILRAGEVVVLPDGVARPEDLTASGWSPDLAAAAIDGAPVATTPLAPVGAAPTDNPFAGGRSDPLIDPIRHRVESGETVYTIARLYGVSVTALASWNGLGPDLALRENQELLIPIVSNANQIVSTVETQPGQVTAVTPPPIAATPLPENLAPGENPESPGLGQFRTPPGGRLSPPVESAIVRAFNPASPSGVGYTAAVGTQVRAAGAGEVVLVSREEGGGGAIVLISHSDDLRTVYSLLGDVTVAEGQQVAAGQVIGAVAPRERQELQFDVFRGLEPIDPTTYLEGS